MHMHDQLNFRKWVQHFTLTIACECAIDSLLLDFISQKIHSNFIIIKNDRFFSGPGSQEKGIQHVGNLYFSTTQKHNSYKHMYLLVTWSWRLGGCSVLSPVTHLILVVSKETLAEGIQDLEKDFQSWHCLYYHQKEPVCLKNFLDCHSIRCYRGISLAHCLLK